MACTLIVECRATAHQYWVKRDSDMSNFLIGALGKRGLVAKKMDDPDQSGELESKTHQQGNDNHTRVMPAESTNEGDQASRTPSTDLQDVSAAGKHRDDSQKNGKGAQQSSSCCSIA
jgi:hypothetical protein